MSHRIYMLSAAHPEYEQERRVHAVQEWITVDSCETIDLSRLDRAFNLSRSTPVGLKYPQDEHVSWWLCGRALHADYLVFRGAEVIHLSQGFQSLHRLYFAGAGGRMELLDKQGVINNWSNHVANLSLVQ